MSLQKLRQVRENKLFRLGDIFVYAGVIALIVVLFVVFVFTNRGGKLGGIEIYENETLLFGYFFSTNEYTITKGYEDRFRVEETENGLVVTIYEDASHEGYNELTIDRSTVSAVVTATNCSAHRDCMFMGPIKDTNGIIICVPHHLKICATGAGQIPDDPVIG